MDRDRGIRTGIFIVAILIATGLIAHNFMDKSQLAVKAAPLPVLPTVTATIGGQQFSLQVVSTTAEQNQGLSDRTSLGEYDGMLFVFNVPSVRYFWMYQMEFPLDMIWIQGDKIVGINQNVPTPVQLDVTNTDSLPIYTSPELVDKVIEVNAGTAAKLGLGVGDTIQLNP